LQLLSNQETDNLEEVNSRMLLWSRRLPTPGLMEGSALLTEAFLSARQSNYQATGNRRCEWFNQTIWQIVKLLLHGRDISENIWEQVSSAIRFLFSDVTCFIAEMYSHNAYVCVSKYRVHF